MQEQKIAVALDGPSGAGKSTIARAVAQRLGLVYVDTGAMYRAIGLAAVRAGIDTPTAENMPPVLQQLGLQLAYVEGTQRVFLRGADGQPEDVSAAIRLPEISLMASKVSALPLVRAHLLELQRNMAKQGVIMDGRDIGTVVLPDAQVKIFLTASPEERARRRHKELVEKGETLTFAQVFDEMQQRDARDTNRTSSPLKQAEDAVLLCTDGMDLEQSVQAVVQMIAFAMEDKSQTAITKP